MNKFWRIFIVHRQGLENKWWHRLANVLIYGTTLIVLIGGIGFIATDSSWREYSYTKYSFEPGYADAAGNEESCSFFSSDYSGPTIYCGKIHTSTDFLERFTSARGTQKNLAKARLESGLSDDQLLNGSIKRGDLNGVKAKRETYILYKIIYKDIAIVAGIVIGLFILLESIIYRSIIYIALGSNSLINKHNPPVHMGKNLRTTLAILKATIYFLWVAIRAMFLVVIGYSAYKNLVEGQHNATPPFVIAIILITLYWDYEKFKKWRNIR